MKQTVAWFNILWKLQKHIHCQPVFTWHWCPARCHSLANINVYQLHSGSSVKASSRTVHAAMAGFVERAGRSADVVNQGLWTVFVYTIMSKVALQYPHEELLMAPVQTTEPWCMVGAYKESTCTGECVFMVRSLRPSHHQISGAWMAAARWLTVVVAKKGNIGFRIQFKVKFVVDVIQVYN